MKPELDPDAVSRSLAPELRTLASWLNLDHIRVARRGPLAAPLSSARSDPGSPIQSCYIPPR